MNKTSYNEQYFVDKDNLQEHLLTTLDEIIDKNRFENILEIACGTGRLLNGLKKNGRNISGCDISFAAAKKADAVVADVTRLPYRSQNFDFLIGISMIEHLKDNAAELFLKEAKRVLKKGGCLFLVTPNYSSPMRYVKGKKWFGYSDPTHVRFYSPKELVVKLEGTGFSDIRMRFNLSRYPDFNWGLPVHLPLLNRFVSWVFISSPLALLRDSFWIMGKIR